MEIQTKTIQNPPTFRTIKADKLTEESEADDDGNDLTEKCQNWLEKCDLGDNCSVYSDSDNSVFTDTTTNSALDSGFRFQNNEIVVGDQLISKSSESNSILIRKESDGPKYDNVNIYKSRKVHVGDVTYINGPVIISNSNSAFNDKKLPSSYIDKDQEFFVVNRINWLAQPALGEKEALDTPVKYLIICHTATEEGFTQADNTLLIRLIQTFHIESRNWKDIAYNFLIGSDGLVYKGRGWNVVGSHTTTWNHKAIAIAFIGCFLDHLPPQQSLQKAQKFIEYGVKIGAIAEDYKLLAHCQCTALESPGKRLFEEIKTWKNWDSSITVPKSSFADVKKELLHEEDEYLQNIP